VPVESRQAEQFINARTGPNGDVDRRVSARIRFRLRSLKNEDHEFLADIQSITVFQDRAKTRVIAEITPPSEKATEKTDSAIK
jgi:hypothetical protein